MTDTSGVVSNDEKLIYWGRCRSGTRWFWAARDAVTRETLHSRVNTEPAAAAAARDAAARLAAGQPAKLAMSHGVATSVLKELNAERRRQKPPAGKESNGATVEYLYGAYDFEDPRGYLASRVASFRITKKTPKRIYYVRREGPGGDVEIGCVNRQELEETGEVRNYAAGGWWAADFHLYAAPPELDRPTAQPDLASLKQAMADAHPDRGGTDEAFIAARARYEKARRAAA